MSLLIRLGQFVEEMRQSWCFDERTQFKINNLELEVVNLQIKNTELEKENLDFKLKCLDTLDELDAELHKIKVRVEEIDAWVRNNKSFDPPHVGSHVCQEC